MPKRVCYIHIGPHKTGTTSIQWFLQENRAELLKSGYFVPESERKRGAHHALAEKLSGLKVGEHREPLVARSIRALAETPSEALIISSEVLDGLLKSRKHADAFFSRIRELNLEPKLILFPRNQPQWINSSYSSAVKTFRRSEPFQTFAAGAIQHLGVKFSPWIELAGAHASELIARPFTKETIAGGVVPEFLSAIGINSSQFRDAAVRRNEAVGPFAVSVARGVLRSVPNSGEPLKWMQAMRCKARLATYLEERGLADNGYCGLTTPLSRNIEAALQSDNNVFAQQVWGRSWTEVFAVDVAQEFTPNDFEMRRPDWFTARRLRRAIREMRAIVDEVLVDPAFAVDAPWNDLRQRSGLV